MYCKNCGKELPDGAKTCPSCGAITEAIPEAITGEAGAQDFKEKHTAPSDDKKHNNKQPIIIILAVVIAAIMAIVSFSVIKRTMLTPEEKESVNQVISQIDSIGEVTTDSKDKLDKAAKLYDDLSEKCRKHVKNYSVLKDDYVLLDQKKAGQVIDEITAIGTVTTDSGDAIDKAQMDYDSLSDDQKALVTNAATLTDDASAFFDACVKGAEDSIGSIGEVTLDSGDAIAKAQEAYDGLTEEQQQAVTNADELKKASETLESLTAINDCEELIDSIGDVTLDDKTVITKAWQQYGGLSDADQKKVSNIKVLQEARNTLDALTAEAKILKVGETVKSNNWEITLVSASLEEKILPGDTNGYYQYYDSGNDSVYIDLLFKIKNTSSSMRGIDEFIKGYDVTYGDNQYNKDYSICYSASSIMLDVYSWDGIDALNTESFHVISKLPEEAKTNDLPITVSVTLGNENKDITVR